MKTVIRTLSLCALVAMFFVGLGQLASTAVAQSVAVAESAVVVADTGTDAAVTAIHAVATYIPSWLATALSIFGTVSIGYQALIAWAHKRAAETADTMDDNWLASLERKAWFRILDRIFYWGGYLGAKTGGRKL